MFEPSSFGATGYTFLFQPVSLQNHKLTFSNSLSLTGLIRTVLLTQRELQALQRSIPYYNCNVKLV